MKTRISLILAILPLLSACDSGIQTECDLIELQGVISNGFDTRGQVTSKPYTAIIPSQTDPLNADVWFSPTGGTYTDTTLFRTISYIGPSVTNPSSDSSGKYLRYDANGAAMYCVGLYPQGVWSTTDGKNATATIDGSRDLMFADQKSGTNSSPLSTTPQQFDHKLTWVKIRVRSESHETGETWGNVMEIKISSASKATVNLGSGTVSFSGNQEIIAFEGNEEMPIMSTEFGDVMISPANALGSGTRYFNVSLKCGNHHKENVQVELTSETGEPYTGETAGKVFVLTLYFKTLKSMDYTATLASWEDEGRVLELE